VIDRLEKAGYVFRERDQGDRRRVMGNANFARVADQVGPTYQRVSER